MLTANNKQHHKKSHCTGCFEIAWGPAWVHRPAYGGRLTHFLPPIQLRHRHISKGRRCHKDHILASWHFFTKTAAGKIRYCKRLLSHTGQEQACTRITRLFVRHHAKNGPINSEMVVDCPIVIRSIADTLFPTRQDQARNEQ